MSIILILIGFFISFAIMMHCAMYFSEVGLMVPVDRKENLQDAFHLIGFFVSLIIVICLLVKLLA